MLLLSYGAPRRTSLSLATPVVAVAVAPVRAHAAFERHGLFLRLLSREREGRVAAVLPAAGHQGGYACCCPFAFSRGDARVAGSCCRAMHSGRREWQLLLLLLLRQGEPTSISSALDTPFVFSREDASLACSSSGAMHSEGSARQYQLLLLLLRDGEPMSSSKASASPFVFSREDARAHLPLRGARKETKTIRASPLHHQRRLPATLWVSVCVTLCASGADTLPHQNRFAVRKPTAPAQHTLLLLLLLLPSGFASLRPLRGTTAYVVHTTALAAAVAAVGLCLPSSDAASFARQDRIRGSITCGTSLARLEAVAAAAAARRSPREG